MIKMINLTKNVYVDREHKISILKDINLEIDNGEFVAITGKSGAGKTTLLNMIGLIDSFDTGRYYLDGEEIRGKNAYRRSDIRNDKVGYIMQNFSLIEEYTVLENVMMPLDFSRKKMRIGEKKRLVQEALKKVDMQDRAK